MKISMLQYYGLAIVVILSFTGIAGAFLGTTNMLAAAVFVTFIIVVGSYAFMKGNIAFPFVNRSNAVLVIVALGVLGLFVGSFARLGLTTGSLLGGADITIPSVPSATAPVVDTRQGVAATVTVYAQDRENDITTTAVTGALIRAYDCDAGYTSCALRSTLGPSTSTDGGSFTSTKGHAVKLVGGNGSFYVDTVTQMVDTEAPAVIVPVHSTSSLGNLVVTCYDALAGTALTSSASIQADWSDYNLTVGASQDVEVRCEIGVSAANVAFNLNAIATAAKGDIQSVLYQGPVSSSCGGHAECSAGSTATFNSAPVPLMVSKAQISNSSGTTMQGGNATGYDQYLETSSPILLREFDSIRYKFTVRGGSTDPAFTEWKNGAVAGDNQDMAIICFLDAVTVRDDLGNEKVSAYTRDASQTNVGVFEDLDRPVGRDACVVLQAN